MATRSMTYDAPGTVFTVHTRCTGTESQTHMIIGREKTGYVADVKFAF